MSTLSFAKLMLNIERLPHEEGRILNVDVADFLFFLPFCSFEPMAMHWIDWIYVLK